MFELNRKLFTTRQNGWALPTYYNKLVGIFQEIDARMSAQGKDVNGVVLLHKHITRLRTYIFLAGLDSEFNNAWSEILWKDLPLDLESSYAYVRRDHNQRKTMEEAKDLQNNAVLVAARTQP